MDSPYLDVQIMAAVDATGRLLFGNAKIERQEPEIQFFRNLTSNSCVIMAPQILEGFGGPLPNRSNMVITDEEGHESPGYMVAENLYEAIRTARMFPQIFVLGGVELYKDSFEYANTLWLAKCSGTEGVGSSKFPRIPKHYEKEEVIELTQGVVVEKWINPERIIKLYKAPKRL